MDTGTPTATETAANKAKREKQATHYFLLTDGSDRVIGADGKPTDKWVEQEMATGYRYASESGWTFDYQVPGAVPGDVQTMLALFGAKTLAINTASAARQAEVDQREALVDRFTKELSTAHWADERTGGGRAYDEETIIAAVVEISKGKATAETVKAKIAATAGGFQAYAKMAMTNPQVNATYNKMKGKVAAKVDALF